MIKFIIQRARNHNSREAALFADLAKAFDTVGHIFIEAILKAMGFPTRFISWVMMSFRKNEVQIIVNGFLTKPYKPGAASLEL